MNGRLLLLLSLILAACSSGSYMRAERYPVHWWAEIPAHGKPSWEILPQDAGRGEVILSKRNELGILSNFAPTPFVFRGKKYASIEGFWQMMLIPENQPERREKVAQMVGFEAKAEGRFALKEMTRRKVTTVSFEGETFPYRPKIPGRHYELIREAMKEKLRQNPRVAEVLLSTGNLKLRPDHYEESGAPPEWRYYDIWMELREEMLGLGHQ